MTTAFSFGPYMSHNQPNIETYLNVIQNLKEKNVQLERKMRNLHEDMIELQVEYTHQQDHILILDQVIVELRTHVESLQKKLDVLEEKLNTTQPETTQFNLQEEKPPHY